MMKNNPSHKIISVDKASCAQKYGIQADDVLIAIDGQPIVDFIDYEYLTTQAAVTLQLNRADGTPYTVKIKKDLYEPLGLNFSSSLMSPMRSCKNHCLFCFIDQMPKGGRQTLQVKDDDWRLSFVMGNYITLTNVDDAEFDRIIERRVSPLYISVHATDPKVRKTMMRNPTAGLILERLQALKEAGLRFHCQIVLCPGINDGAILDQTLRDLSDLYPAAQSVAVVPVGLTKYREGLYPLRLFTQAEARCALAQIRQFQIQCLQQYRTAFVFASDEFYILAKQPLPAYKDYEEFPQIENGVGLLRQFEYEFFEALKEYQPLTHPRAFAAVGGVSAAPFLEALYARLQAYGITIYVHPVRNDYFGHTITVGGLVTGTDIVNQLKGRLESDTLLLPRNMLRETEDVFLDGMTLSTLSHLLEVRIIPVRADGEDWIRTVFETSNLPNFDS